MKNKTNNKFSRFARLYVPLFLSVMSIIAPYFTLQGLRMTQDVLIGRIIFWFLFWSIPHLIISYLIFARKPQSYNYSFILTSIVAVVVLVFIPLNYNITLLNNDNYFPLFLIGALYASSALTSYIEYKKHKIIS